MNKTIENKVEIECDGIKRNTMNLCEMASLGKVTCEYKDKESGKCDKRFYNSNPLIQLIYGVYK